MVLRGFEDRLERLVEGVFSRAFKSGLQPVEIGRRLVRDIDASRRVDINGRGLAPNRFVIRVSPEDAARLAAVEASLIDELVATVRGYTAQQRLHFLGHISVELETDPSLRVGIFRVHPSYDDRLTSVEPGGWLEGPHGDTYELRNDVITIGRLSTSDIVVDDQNVSRQHAELRPHGTTFQLVDLGSTNGSRVNGARVDRHLLSDGDEIAFGPVRLLYRRV